MCRETIYQQEGLKSRSSSGKILLFLWDFLRVIFPNKNNGVYLWLRGGYIGSVSYLIVSTVPLTKIEN